MNKSTYMRFVKTIANGPMRGVTKLIEINNPLAETVESYKSAQLNQERLFDGVNAYTVNHLVIE